MSGADPLARRDGDDGQSHFPKVAGVRETIEATGAELRLLPTYSPDLNPIEQSFAKLKAHLRKAGERSIPALWDRIGSILQNFTPDECKNYFTHAGYGSN